MLVIWVLLAVACLAYGQVSPIPQQGDYRANGTKITPKISSATGWQIYDRGNWVNATLSPLAYQQPFTNRIFMGAAEGIEVDSNFILRGDFVGSTNNKLVTVKAGKVFEFGTNLNSRYDLANLTVEAGARFINNGSMTSTSMTSKILLKAGTTPDSGGTLENRGMIDTAGFIDKEANSVIISRPNGVIKGGALLDVKAAGATIYIENPGGYSAAIQLTRHQNIHNACIVFSGAGNQITGNTPDNIYKVTVADGTNLTLTKNIVLINEHKDGTPTFKVEGGGTLDTGNFIITTDKVNQSSEAQFVLDSGATIRTPNVNGISSVKSGNKITSGAIQTNNATYSEEANYVYYGNTTNQFSGCFITDPPTNPASYKVHDFIIENPNGLTLCSNFQPLTVTGDFQGMVNGGPGYVSHQPTLPVTLSYFNAFFNGFDSVTLRWETQSETNNLGFYILRSDVPDAEHTGIISALIPAANSSQGASYFFEDNSLDVDGIYFYWLQDVSFSGEVELHGPAMAQVSLQGDSNYTPDIPLKTSLIRNYPNPFNPSTQLEYYLEESADVDFKVYNLKGQLVDQFTLRHQTSGFHRYAWKPQLESGVYLVSFTAGGKNNTRQVVLSK